MKGNREARKKKTQKTFDLLFVEPAGFCSDVVHSSSLCVGPGPPGSYWTLLLGADQCESMSLLGPG